MRGRIPREFIDELLARTDIVELIDTRVPLTKAGRDFKACCRSCINSFALCSSGVDKKWS